VNGSCISDVTDACEDAVWKNHGEYVAKCIIPGLKSLGLYEGDKQYDGIVSCAAQSDIGKKDK
jgi:hypothetical protein